MKFRLNSSVCIAMSAILLTGVLVAPASARSEVLYTPKGHILRNIPLPQVPSCEVLQWRLQGQDQQYRLQKLSVPATGAPAPMPTMDSGAMPPEASFGERGGGGSSDFSTTNVQVEGVDEADVIKNDGEFIYIVKGRSVRIVKAFPASHMEEVAIVSDPNDTHFRAQEVYLADNRLVIIGSAYQEYGIPEKSMAMPIWGGTSVTKVYVYDVSDKKHIKEERSLEMEGNYFTSRRIDNQLYLLLQHYPHYYPMLRGNPQIDDSQMVNEQTLMPYIKDSAARASEPVAKCGDVTFFPGYRSANFLMIVSVPLDTPKVKAKRQVFLGAADNAYASLDNLYVTVANYPYFGGPEIMIWPPPRRVFESTMIYKFSLEKGNVAYQGAGEVPGTVLNQFSMDEHKNHFRVTTTYGNLWSDGEDYARNNLFILDSNMDRVGEITDIAPREKIYSTRFIGDRAYMVTFKNTDPLFVIDTQDPKNPKILGQLKIPGYSTYLHPYDANHLIGFGKEAVESIHNKDFAWYQGLKVAIFDVSDVANPREKFKVIIGDRGTESELLYNHKALLFDRQKELLAFPVTLAEIKNPQNATPDIYGDYTFQGAYVYRLNLHNGFQFRGRITHYENQDDFLKAGHYFGGGGDSIMRALYMDDTLYTVSENKVMANDLEDMRMLNGIRLLPDSTY